MIKSNIQLHYPHQYLSIITFSDNIYIADYTELTRNISPKRSVEIFSPIPCSDNDYFSVINPNAISIDSIIFNNSSFVYANGNSKNQCETITFPSNSTNDTWILLTELKYSNVPLNNKKNLKKAIKQLFKTWYHYILSNTITKNQKFYLIASLPKQTEPFANFIVTQTFLTNLKTKRNIILRLKNSIEIQSDEIILV